MSTRSAGPVTIPPRFLVRVLGMLRAYRCYPTAGWQSSRTASSHESALPPTTAGATDTHQYQLVSAFQSPTTNHPTREGAERIGAQGYRATQNALRAEHHVSGKQRRFRIYGEDAKQHRLCAVRLGRSAPMLIRVFGIFLAVLLTCWPNAGYSQATQVHEEWNVIGPVPLSPIEERHHASSPLVSVHSPTPESEKHPDIIGSITYSCTNTPTQSGHFHENVSFVFINARAQSGIMIDSWNLKIRVKWSDAVRVDVYPANYLRWRRSRHISLGNNLSRLSGEMFDMEEREKRHYVSRFLNRVATASWVLVELGFPESQDSLDYPPSPLSTLYFRYPLGGAKEAINKARIACGGETI